MSLVIRLVLLAAGSVAALFVATDADIFPVAQGMVAIGLVALVVVAVALLVVFGGGRFLAWFPSGGLASAEAAGWAWPWRVLDLAWHLALPVAALVISGFSSLALLTRNLFLEEIGKHYVLLARAKGLAPRRVLLGHVFRNAMLLVVAGLPGALLGVVIVGVIEPFAARFLPPGYSQIAPYALLILVLIFRPHGLFAQVRTKKV